MQLNNIKSSLSLLESMLEETENVSKRQKETLYRAFKEIDAIEAEQEFNLKELNRFRRE